MAVSLANSHNSMNQSVCEKNFNKFTDAFEKQCLLLVLISESPK